MLVFPKTEAALRNLTASHPLIEGSHRSMEIRASGLGVPVGSVDYDESEHLLTDIDHFDFVGEMLTGKKQVAESRPFNPLDFNLVVHHDPRLMDITQGRNSDEELRGMAMGRLVLARTLEATLTKARPGMYDRVKTYHVGDVKVRPQSPYGRIVSDTEDPLRAAQEVADISRRGHLTFVISGFRGLPLVKAENLASNNIVAIMADHAHDRKLPAGKKIWFTGHPDMPDVNANDPSQLAIWNAYLDKLHARRLERLGALGLSVAEAEFDPFNEPHFMDVNKVDKSIATAVEQVSKKL